MQDTDKPAIRLSARGQLCFRLLFEGRACCKCSPFPSLRSVSKRSECTNVTAAPYCTSTDYRDYGARALRTERTQVHVSSLDKSLKRIAIKHKQYFLNPANL
jgi:hypothetical protein